ncbi:unnamed protein product [Psylliodes chrysocephalus]|uniref:BED-type domain-containing protein n=1 Tax=Psylliodes chrysocephalus TaxID=3402493 RepID=A0A9P0GE22_9CUCU|nr:unnamed protein product [Psylliodes chrysocephala]
MDKFLISKRLKTATTNVDEASTSNKDLNLEQANPDTNSNSGAEESDGASATSTASTASESVLSRSNKRKKMSTVWKYFKKKSDDKKFAKCLTCSKEYKTSGNTSNLKDHLKRFHFSTFSETGEVSDDAQAPRSNFRSISSIVNDVGFKKFVNLLDPKYVLPSKTTLRDTIQKKLYLEGVTKLKDILKNIEFLAITSDCWTSLASESYISVTRHFIDENFQLKNAILHTKKLDSRHTGENIANALSEIFTEWNIQKKISCFVTDNAANALKMCQILKIKNLPCFAHSLNLVVQDNLHMPVVKDTIKKCKEIVTFIKNSNIAADTFQKEQETCDKQYKLIQEVKTRWNSTLYMLKRIVDTADALNRTLLKSKKAPSPITAEEMIILKDLIKCLDIFEDATNKVSGATYVTVSLIIPITFGIYCNLTDLVKNLSSE